MKRFNRNSIFILLMILSLSFLLPSCSSFLYSSRRSQNNSLIITSNVKDFTVKFPLDESRNSYYSHGFSATDNKANIELPNLSKRYLTIEIAKENFEPNILKIKKTVRGAALLMDIGLSIFTIGLPIIIDPFRSDFYKINSGSKKMYVEMKYSRSFLENEYKKIEDSDAIMSFYDYNTNYPDSPFKNNVLAKIDSLEYCQASKSQKVAILKEFIRNNGNSKYKVAALTQIDSLDLEVELMKYNIEGLQQFISTHPNSKFINKAKLAIKDFNEIDSVFEQVKIQNDLTSYRNFINKYPNSRYEMDAKKVMASMVETGTFEIKDGVIYKGDFRTTIDNKRVKHGKGVIIFPNGARYDGTWNEDNLTNGIYYDEKGEVIYEGEWKKGEYSGKGKLRPRKGEFSGYTLDGYFLMGKANGFGTFYKPDSTKEYEGYWKDGRYDGNGTFYLNGIKMYVGEFKNGQTEGQGTVYAQNGQIEGEGQFKNWKLNGYGRRYKNGKIDYEGYLTDNIPNGLGILYNENGNKEYEGNFYNGLANGKGASFKKNGQKEFEGLFVNGVFTPEKSSNSSVSNSSNDKLNEDAALKFLDGLTANEKSLLTKVIDGTYDSDPQHKMGKTCGYGSGTCKWCGKSIKYAKVYNSRAEDIKMLFSPIGTGVASMQALGLALFTNKDPYEEFGKEIKKNIKSIMNGELYYCNGNPPEFCSEKCEYEYSLHH